MAARDKHSRHRNHIKSLTFHRLGQITVTGTSVSRHNGQMFIGQLQQQNSEDNIDERQLLCDRRKSFPSCMLSRIIRYLLVHSCTIHANNKNALNGILRNHWHVWPQLHKYHVKACTRGKSRRWSNVRKVVLRWSDKRHGTDVSYTLRAIPET